MKKFVVLGAVAALVLSVPAMAAPKTYQVTGPVVEMSSDKMVVQKGKEKWEIQMGSASMPADVKVGSKVMVEYTMTAMSVTSKDMPPKSAMPMKQSKSMKSMSGKSEPASAAMAPAPAAMAPASGAMAPSPAPASK